MNNMQKEKWLPIPGYEEYEVSNMGRIKRLSYNKRIGYGGMQPQKERILSPRLRKAGYLGVCLSKNGKIKSMLIHRIVAMVFIPNPNKYPQVNHKDENPANNCADNLEWCSSKYNNNYGTKGHRLSASFTNNPKRSKPVQQYTKGGLFVQEFPSAAETARRLGLYKGGIVSCCNGIYPTYHGFIFKYKLPKEDEK